MARRLRAGLLLLALGALWLVLFPLPDGDDRHAPEAVHDGRAPETSAPVLVGHPPVQGPTTPRGGADAGEDRVADESPQAPIATTGSFVAGRVVFAGGAPGDRIEVGFRSLASRGAGPGRPLATVRSDTQGRFRFDGVRAGPCLLSAPDDGSPQTRARAHTGDADLLLVVRARRIRAVVEDTHGNPVPDADLGMRWFREYGPAIGRAPVRPDGCVDLWLEPGTRVILAAHGGGARVAEAEVTVTADLARRDVHLVLPDEDERRGFLRLRVVDPAGSVVAPVYVYPQSPLAQSNLDRRPCPYEITEEESVAKLPVGRWHLTVYAEGAYHHPYTGFLLPLDLDVEIEADRETRVDAVISWGGRIRVHDRRPQDDEVAAWVDLERDGRATRYSISPEPGEACLGPLLEPGPWTMVFRDDEGREARRDVVIRPGIVLDVE